MREVSSPRGEVSGSHGIAHPGKAVLAVLPASHRSPGPEPRRPGLCMSESPWQAVPLAPGLSLNGAGRNRNCAEPTCRTAATCAILLRAGLHSLPEGLKTSSSHGAGSDVEITDMSTNVISVTSPWQVPLCRISKRRHSKTQDSFADRSSVVRTQCPMPRPTVPPLQQAALRQL